MLLLPGDISLFFYEATDFIQPPWLIKVHKNLEAFQALPLKRRRKRKYVRGSWLQMVVAFRCNQGELGCLVCIKEALPPPQPPLLPVQHHCGIGEEEAELGSSQRTELE
jgi:hypothetical protein